MSRGKIDASATQLACQRDRPEANIAFFINKIPVDQFYREEAPYEWRPRGDYCTGSE